MAGWVLAMAVLATVATPASSATLPQPVVTLTSSLNPATVRQSVTLTATVRAPVSGDPAPTGTVSFVDSRAAFICRSVAISLGRATCTGRLAAGDRTIWARYEGDATYGLTYSEDLRQRVQGDPAIVTVSSSPNPSVTGQPVTLRASVVAKEADAPVATGTVRFTHEAYGECGDVPLVGGEATCTFGHPFGTFPFTAAYSGDDWFSGATAPAATQAVGQAATRVVLTTSANPAVGGQRVLLIASVEVLAPGAGSRLDDAITISPDFPGADCSGRPIVLYGRGCIIHPPAGTWSVRATYPGSAGYSASTSAVLIQTVVASTPTVELTTSANPSPYDQEVTFRATVRAPDPSFAVPMGTVTFSGLPAACADRPLRTSFGITYSDATCTTLLPRGPYLVTAAYNGDGRYRASPSLPLVHASGPANTFVNVGSSANPVSLGGSTTLTATVSPLVPATGTPTGSVTFLAGATPLCIAPLAGGAATCSTTLGLGTHTVTAVYSGDDTFGSKTSSPLSQVVVGPAGTVTLSSDPNPSVLGQPVTFRATVHAGWGGGGAPSGTVRFSNNGWVDLCPAAPVVAGVATCITETFRAGSHAIIATYSGDGSNGPATSPPLTQVVQPGDAVVTLTSSANPALAGDPVTLTASVRAADPDVAAPFGEVTIMDGTTTVCGPSSIDYGPVSCPVTLAVGAHSLTAVYGGTDQTNAATSGPLDQSVVAAGTGYVPMTPARLLDTRSGLGGPAGPVRAGTTRELVVRGGATGVPDSATAVVVNMTVTASAAAGYLTVHPTWVGLPNAASLTFATGQTIPNLVMSGVGTGGRISIYTSAATHVIADIVGYHLPGGGAAFTPLTPSRLLDTRIGTGGPAAPVGPGATRELVVRGGGTGIPDDATAVVLNTTATAPTAASYLTVHPAGVARPTASNLNVSAGQTIPNLVIVGVGVGGRISIFNAAGSVHVLADVVGFYRPGAGAAFTAVTPSRLLDTRSGIGGPATPVAPTTTRALVARGASTGIPDTARAVVLNVTAVLPSASSYLTVHPSGVARPTASNLNYGPGQVISNLVVVAVGTDGTVSLFNAAGSVHLVADVVGYMS